MRIATTRFDTVIGASVVLNAVWDRLTEGFRLLQGGYGRDVDDTGGETGPRAHPAGNPAGYLHRAETESAYTADARNLLAGVREGAGRAVHLFRRAQTAIELARVQILLHPRRAVDVDSLPLRPPALVASGAANVDAAWMVYMEKVDGYRQRRAAALAA